MSFSAKGLTFHPPCHVGDEWFVPIGIPASSCRFSPGNEIGASPLLLLTVSSGSGHTRRLPEDYHVTSRYWKYRFHAPVCEPGDADDARVGILLWRTRRTKERARHHDAKF